MSEVDDEDDGLVSSGRGADESSTTLEFIPSDLRSSFEFFSYRNAAAILANTCSSEFGDIIALLRNLKITEKMIRVGGGNKGPIAHKVDELMPDDWVETRISADLNVKLLDASQRKNPDVLRRFTIGGYLDGHRIDFVHGKVAFDLEWNSKDQTYDRDLYAFSAFYDAGAIDVGVILTRGFSLNNDFFRSLGNELKKDGTEGTKPVHSKFGASTTWMGKLLYRLDAGRNGGCPVLAIGITQNQIEDQIAKSDN